MNTPRTFKGFTMIELVMVMVLTGILAAVALPRYVDRKTFDAVGFFDQTITMVRYAQKLAIAQRRDVYVNIIAGSGKICLTYAADVTCTGASNAINPADLTSFAKTAPAGSSFGASSSVSFNGLGRPTPNVTAVINMTIDTVPKTITIEAETGYVH